MKSPASAGFFILHSIMFTSAIETVAGFTRPIHSILRTYQGNNVLPGSATLFFVNDQGDAVTCKHVAELLARSETINQQYQLFRQEKNQIRQDNKASDALHALEQKYQYQPDTLIQIKNNFMDCVDQIQGLTWHLHPTLDLAIIRFQGFNQRHYRQHALFAKRPEQLKQGKFLCRLGYPFPEFTNFRYNASSDDLEWTNSGVSHAPQFPIEGMVTRFLSDGTQFYGIEMSTPGLRGQSGGPLFDENGIVYGLQYSTKHLHLGFDLVDMEVMVNNQVRKVTDYSFLHLGQCIHVDVIKSFLRQHQVPYSEA